MACDPLAAMRIKLSYYFSQQPLLRQTPGGTGYWRSHTFLADNPAVKSCDAWVVLDDPAAEETVRVEAGRTILVTMEPPGLREYPAGYLAQFDLVITCHPELPHPNIRKDCQGLPWHAGLRKLEGGRMRGTESATMGYDDFVAAAMPEKSAALSVISSADTRLPGHRARLAFIEELRARLGDRIEVFGRDIRPVSDKLDAILPYRYHLVLENSRLSHYWTEKLSDSFLGWAWPIYWGCPNIGEYFSADAYSTLDIESANAVGIVESLIAHELTPAQCDGLARARDLVLHRYNLFDVLARACESLPAGIARDATIRPLAHFRRPKLHRFLSRMTGG
ncbi:MAG: glycosyltransferase family 10 domain-containing protein [Propylenella sp.]